MILHHEQYIKGYLCIYEKKIFIKLVGIWGINKNLREILKWWKEEFYVREDRFFIIDKI